MKILLKIKRIIKIFLAVFFTGIILINITLLIKSNNNKGKIADFMGYTPFIVSSDSMKPVLEMGDFIITKKVKEDELKVGDIIAYYDKENKLVVIHRIIRIEKDDKSNNLYVMKGDKITKEDKIRASIDNIEGKYVCTIPLIGNIALSLKSSNNIVLIIGIIIILYIIFDIVDKELKRKIKKYSKENENKEDKENENR